MAERKSFIEVQFPVSKVSKESYKERKAVQGQTLTGLGKWWGRKPLILIRAALLGLLMPASDDPKKDMKVFLKILTMDEDGLCLRKNKFINPDRIYEIFNPEMKNTFSTEEHSGKLKYKTTITQDEKNQLQKNAFQKMSYDEKIQYCIRPEELIDDNVIDWAYINEHLGTAAKGLTGLFRELGSNKYKQIPTIGDCFCGGGSVSFETVRLGLHSYASDLNPIATLLTWASLNIISISDKKLKELNDFQEKIFCLVDKKLVEWGVENNEKGSRANAYLYCSETKCPECGYLIPLAPSWVIGRGSKTVGNLLKNSINQCYDIEIKSCVDAEELRKAELLGTIKNDRLHCPNCNCITPISVIKDNRNGNEYDQEKGLRHWELNDLRPRDSDVFKERLYCIRYTHQYIDEKGVKKSTRYYVSPGEDDLKREQKVIDLLNERFEQWQEKGYIPNSRITEGYNTNQVIRERGWVYWHQLFNPRQLLIHGLLMQYIDSNARNIQEYVIGLLGINRCCNWNSKLCSWGVGAKRESMAQTFYNQAFNTFYNYGCKGLNLLKSNWFLGIKNIQFDGLNNHTVVPLNASNVSEVCDIWITDPPYADAINYHELSDFFLSWDKNLLINAFPSWYADSKSVLAVKGKGYLFNKTMVDIYSSLANHMPDNGMQIVMFTHQDVKVWAELTLIIWASNLRVTAAWNIATETDSGGLKDGNYVKGTVLLVLRKQTSEETAFEDELYIEIEEEVKRQVDSMRTLDDKEDPNFNDADYLLAAYASSLKVLTSYKNIKGMDVQYELSKDRKSGEPSPVERMIRSAVKIAYDYLIPGNFDSFIWKLLTTKERFYIKGIEAEKHGNTQLSTYQELARGFGINDYKDMLAHTKANNARLMTASEYKMSGMQSDEARVSVVRNALTAIFRAMKEEDPIVGKNWLRNELEGYWEKRESVIEILDYISELEHHDHMEHWVGNAYYARLIRELVKNDGY